MIEDFRKKLKEDGRSLSWFHKTYINDDIMYVYFAQQVGGFSKISKNVEAAIKRYLDKK